VRACGILWRAKARAIRGHSLCSAAGDRGSPPGAFATTIPALGRGGHVDVVDGLVPASGPINFKVPARPAPDKVGGEGLVAEADQDPVGKLGRSAAPDWSPFSQSRPGLDVGIGRAAGSTPVSGGIFLLDRETLGLLAHRRHAVGVLPGPSRMQGRTGIDVGRLKPRELTILKLLRPSLRLGSTIRRSRSPGRRWPASCAGRDLIGGSRISPTNEASA